MSRAIILTAIPVEYKAVRVHLTDLREEMHRQGTIYERGKFVANATSWEVGIVEVGAGNASAAVEAERAIAYFNKELDLVESELKSRQDPDVSGQLQKALDWLSKRDIIAAKAGEEALKKFPRLTKNKFNIKRFYSEIERYLDLIYHSLLDLEQSKELLQAPPIRQIFSNPSIYVEALNTVKKRIPEDLNQLARQEIESRIDYLKKEIT